MNITKDAAVKILIEAAKSYNDDLLNKNVLFVFYDYKNKRFDTVEVEFQKRNFAHLTGTKPINMLADDFFDRCLDKRINPSMFEFKPDGTTGQKLSIIRSIVSKNIFYMKMIGTYNGYQLDLRTDRLVGGVNACLGFIKDDDGSYFVPNTLLNIDIRLRVEYPCQIVCTFVKDKKEDKYSMLTYKAKKFDYSKLIFPNKYNYLKDLM